MMMWATWIPDGANSLAKDWATALRPNLPAAWKERERLATTVSSVVLEQRAQNEEAVRWVTHDLSVSRFYNRMEKRAIGEDGIPGQ